MNKIDYFMTELSTYFGGYKNQFIAKEIKEELSYIDPRFYNAILKQIKDTVPSAFAPDKKNLMDAIKVLEIQKLDEPTADNNCQSCGKKIYILGGVCPWCCYDKFREETPEEWREFVALAHSGKKPMLDFRKMIRELPRNETREQFDQVLASAKNGGRP